MDRSATFQPIMYQPVGNTPNFPPPEPSAILVHDSFNWLSVIRNLKPSDIIVLVTPVVRPVSNTPAAATDPFECLGAALQTRHRKIRHVPYIVRDGITSTHLGIIKRAKITVFATNEPPQVKDGPQTYAGLVLRKFLKDERPLIVVLACRDEMIEQFCEDFPTIIQTTDYTRPTLEASASLIFGKGDGLLTTSQGSQASQKPPPTLWKIEHWNEVRDMGGIYDLWTQSIDVRFAMRLEALAALLRRPGYARHYVVRDVDGQLLGFCATFLSYVDQAGENLIGSIAVILVDLEYQSRGIGLSLHNHAVDHLKRTKGVSRLQLGSTFPRILYGPPFYMDFNQTWFSRRGWRLDREFPGQGKPVYDMLLEFSNWAFSSPVTTTTFRTCTQNDMAAVLRIVEAEVAHEHKMGWFDQYSRLVGDFNVKDVMLALEDESVVGIALTYTPSCCSPISQDLPWAGRIGDEVGGVTCICMPPARRDTLLVPLIDACIKKLQGQDMKRVYLDGLTINVEPLKELGFREWAAYKDVWRDN